MTYKPQSTEKSAEKFTLLPLNLQYFAQGDDDPQDEPKGDVPKGDDPQGGDAPKDDDGKQSDKNKPEDVKFTEEQQAAINRIVQERLKKERDKAKKAEEEAALKEQGKFKDLLESKEKELAALQEKVKTSELDGLKTRLLVGAGYAEEQFEFVKKNLEGETEEELKASLEQVKQYIAPKTEGADPVSKGNGKRQTPPPSNDEEYGREMAKKLFEKQKRFSK